MSQDHMSDHIQDETFNHETDSAAPDHEVSWNFTDIFGLDACCGVLFSGPSDNPNQELRSANEISDQQLRNVSGLPESTVLTPPSVP